MNPCDRRSWLRRCAVAGTAAVAGCSALDSDEGTELGDSTGSNESSSSNGSDSDSGERASDGDEETIRVGPEGAAVFEPGTDDPIAIDPGTTVVFVWESDGHNIRPTATPDGADWDGEPEAKEEGFEHEHTFEVEGRYEFECEPHASQGMRGELIVGDADPAGEKAEKTTQEVIVGPEEEFAFEPAELDVSSGTTVVFTWDSDNHNLNPSSVPDEADWEGHQPLENSGFEYEYTFEVEGEYEYVCDPHVGQGMEGTITVTESYSGDHEIAVGPNGDRSFDPATLEVEPNARVAFTWESDGHTVTPTKTPAASDDWGEPNPHPEGHATIDIFRAEGEYEYVCEPHADEGMEGRIIVSGDYESETTIGDLDGEWTQFGFDAANTGYQPEGGVDGGVAPAWRVVCYGSGTTQYPPAVTDGTLYTFTMSELLALEAATGDLRWRTKLDEGRFWGNSAPAVVDDLVYAGRDTGMAAYDRTDGTERWYTEVNGGVASATLATDSKLCFTTVTEDVQKCHCLDAKSGDIRWDFEFDEPALADPATDGSRVYVAGWDERLRALDFEIGEETWSVEIEGGVSSGPAVADGLVYTCGAADTSGVFAFDAQSGEKRWSRSTDASTSDSPIVADGTVLVTHERDSGGEIVSLDAKDGSERWTRDVAEPEYLGSAVAGDSVLVTVGERVVALDVADGSARWEYDVGVSITDPIVVDGAVFVGGDEIHAVASPE